MTFGESLLKSCRNLQRSWVRLADSAFGRAMPEADEMARGEFISAFICEPASRPPRGTPRQETAN